MDKTITYPGAIPLDTDILQPQRNVEYALGRFLAMAIGTSTVIDGLAVTQQSSPNMTVQVGPGTIAALTAVDPSGIGYGSIPPDSTNIMKLGINNSPVNMTALVAPSVSGQSQNWLVEAQFLEQDIGAAVLPYYNGANPLQPYTGPSNAGTAQNTRRTNSVQLQWKAGTAAATGQQNTPTPDAGWVGVAIVTVANGQSSITNANISAYSSAPVVPTKLAFQRQRLLANLNLYVSPFGSDTANSGLSLASPFATLQKAWNTIVTNYDLNGFNVTVNVANGTYTSGVLAIGSPLGAIGGVRNGQNPPWPAGPAVSFVGNPGSPSSCIVNVGNGNCFSAADGAQLLVSGFTLLAGGTSADFNQVGVALYAFSAAGVQFNSVIFGTCSVAHIISTVGSIIESAGAPYTISGGASFHMNVFANGYITTSGSAVTLTGTPAFPSGFLSAATGSLIYVNSATSSFSGTATGPRYLVSTNGVIQTNGGGASFLPGSSTGSVLSGGQYA